jgi:Skp family chaperone for outer membrane proteins
MKQHSKRINWPAVALLASIVAMLGYQSWAMRSQEKLAPAVVVCVDLEKVFNGLTAKTNADAHLRKLGEEQIAESNKKAEAIKQMEADLADLAAGSARYRELQDQALLEAQKYRAYVEFSRAKIDAERSRTIKRIYGDIKKAADEMATSNGYDLVLVNDSLAEIPPGTEEEMNRQISARRILFANPRIDLTDELIAYMNAAAQKTP